jgi:hypothetical protein
MLRYKVKMPKVVKEIKPKVENKKPVAKKKSSK